MKQKANTITVTVDSDEQLQSEEEIQDTKYQQLTLTSKKIQKKKREPSQQTKLIDAIVQSNESIRKQNDNIMEALWNQITKSRHLQEKVTFLEEENQNLCNQIENLKDQLKAFQQLNSNVVALEINALSPISENFDEDQSSNNNEVFSTDIE